MSTLMAFRIPFHGLPYWDHTYVQSSNGDTWKCFGRGAGGEPLCEAAGDAELAEEMAQPTKLIGVPPVSAGLLYGMDGVCHQAANRILFHSGQTVRKAHGYGVSKWLYGVYGQGWPEHAAEHGITPTARVAAAAKAELPERFAADEGLHMASLNFVLAVSAMFRMDLAHHLSDRLDSLDLERVLNIQMDLLQVKAQLDQQFRDSTLGPLEYARLVNEHIVGSFIETSHAMDADSFKRMFDVEPGHEPNLVEAALMAV